MIKELFPLRIASGKRFCNRHQERDRLKKSIQQKSPVVLISPRRYGKTSLSNKVVEELKYPFCSIDLLTAYDDNSICYTIIKGVSELISQIMPINMKTVKLVESCFHGVKAVLRYKELELEFTSSIEKTDPVRQVLEALKGLDKLANKLDKTVVVFIDEFQNVIETPKGEAIQGSIRHVAQSAKNIAFLFSGSSRHMLLQAFDNSEYPLYMMCEKLFLDRIDSDHYYSYIQEASMMQWNEKIRKEIIQRILDLTENHPFYVNFLCNTLWRKNDLPAHSHLVDETWHDCLLMEERRLITELESLTVNQRVLLKAISHANDLKEPTAASFLSPIGLSSGTATQVIKSLLKKDMIFVDNKNSMRVLDPLMKYMLLNAS